MFPCHLELGALGIERSDLGISEATLLDGFLGRYKVADVAIGSRQIDEHLSCSLVGAKASQRLRPKSNCRRPIFRLRRRLRSGIGFGAC